MNPIVVAAVISSLSTLIGVFLTSYLQTRKIDMMNRAALREQTKKLVGEIND